VKVRTNRYLNKIVEQDHRAINRRCASMAGLKSFANATVTITLTSNSLIVFGRGISC
jgi:transposase-like protein